MGEVDGSGTWSPWAGEGPKQVALKLQVPRQPVEHADRHRPEGPKAAADLGFTERISIRMLDHARSAPCPIATRPERSDELSQQCLSGCRQADPWTALLLVRATAARQSLHAVEAAAIAETLLRVSHRRPPQRRAIMPRLARPVLDPDQCNH